MPNWISFSQKERRGTHHSSTGLHLSKPIIKTEKEEEGYYGLNTSSPGPVWEGLCTWILPCFVTQVRRPETRWLVSNFRIIFLPFTTFSCSVGYFYEVNVYLSKAIISLSDLPRLFMASYRWSLMHAKYFFFPKPSSHQHFRAHDVIATT